MLSYEHLDKAMEPGYGETNRHRAFNFQICQTISLLDVKIILDRMEKLGLSKEESKAISLLVQSTQCLLRQANDRLHNKELGYVYIL